MGALLATPLLTSAAGATTLSLGEGLGIAGAALGGFGSIFSGIQQAQANTFNAKVARQQADQAEAEAAADAEQTRQDNQRKLGAAEAAFGASGVDLQGSPLDVLSDLATQGELSRRLILYKGKNQANQFLTQAAIDRSQAGAALAGGILGAGTTVLTSALAFGSDSVKPTLPAAKPLTVPRAAGRPVY
jgi:hypothetical protein